MHAFRCATLSPSDLSHARLASATACAGGVGLLDTAHVPDARLPRAHEHLAHLLNLPASGQASVGLRLRAGHIDRWARALDALAGREHWILLCDWTTSDLAAALRAVDRPRAHVWIEVRSVAEIDEIQDRFDAYGYAACGAECGGFSGRDSAFILAQRLARQSRPFLVRGGIGLHTSAACRVAGAAGVVLDDTLLLLPESPLPARWQARLRRLGMTDTMAIGTDPAVRVVNRPDWPAGRDLRARGASREAIDELVRWDDPDRCVWPIGEGAGRAAATADRYPGVARFVRAVLRASEDHLRTADRDRPLAEAAPLAAEHGTRYPIVQGPMTRVSDRPAFAARVAEAGALPMVALALMRQQEVDRLLDETRAALAGDPWGVGILGFVPDDLRREQLDAVARVRPPFALIAGGRPEQAAALEREGVRTYLHAPAPVLEAFLDAGARRFVFEGAECGGHIGPLHSFALWDFVVDTLAARKLEADRIDVLFAGGIHDAVSSAMVAALAAPLAARGAGVGVLMGTAYLFTREAVDTAAITETFHRQAVECRATATIETGPGHVIRCLPTPFVHAFADQDRALRGAGFAGQELRAALEQVIVGRSRIASKGLERDQDRLRPVPPAQQLSAGLFMVGDVAELRETSTTLAELHASVSLAGPHVVHTAAAALEPPRPASRRQAVDVAIVGASCIVPGARTPAAFWRNLLAQVPAIREIPQERWDWRLYYDPTVAARDKIVSKWGGFVDPVPFDPVEFGIPPKSLPSITVPQLLALELTRRALIDAGLGDGVAPDVRARTAVMFGIANTADIGQMYAARATLPLVVGGLTDIELDRLPEWTEESYPGLLTNVVAGRVANRFDFGGPNFTLDAACASSLAALDLAVQEVASGRSDLALAGGLECELTPHAYLGFSHTRALSPRGRADVFDRRADGIVISEGGVVLVLKRLPDAVRDGDRVYAVIKGLGGSSDGRGRSLTAPRPGGQRVAFSRAYEAAAVEPGTIGLYEAHATGTAVGDAAEVETICGVLQEHGAPAGGCVIGSVKSLIGHTRSAAGMVSVLKTALSLHHRVLPPHAGASDPLPSLTAPSAPVRLLSEPAPWLATPEAPRRAGVSAFGFGGTNFHAVLEEYAPPDAGELGAPGGREWPAELFAFSAADAATLSTQLQKAERAARWLDEIGSLGCASDWALRDLAFACAAAARPDPSAIRLAFVASTPAEVVECVNSALQMLAGEPARDSRVVIGSTPPVGRVAFLFPGQGSQYPGMGAELSLFSPELRTALEIGDRLLTDLPKPLSRFVMPSAAFDEAGAGGPAAQLADTRVAQPAIGVISAGMLDFARRLGIEPDVVAGHSYGELVALHAAGSVARHDLLNFSAARGRAMAGGGGDAGVMAAVDVDAETAAAFLDEPRVVVANCNAPDQTVLAGARGPMSSVIDRLRAAGHGAVPLNVSGAFHSPMMAAARPHLVEALASLPLEPPRLPVYGNLDGRPYPSSVEAIRQQLTGHLEHRVNFLAQVEEMYAAGVRLFIEVGPGRALTGLVKRTLRGRSHVALAVDGGVRAWLGMVAHVFADGRRVDLETLFADRAPRWLDLDRLPIVPRGAWSIDGGRVWPSGTAHPAAGRAPLLDEAHRDTRSSGPSDAVATAYREYQQTMREFLAQQERWLDRIVSGDAAAPVVSTSPGPAAAAVAPAEPVKAPLTAAAPAVFPTTSPADREGLTRLLVSLVAERTGYSPEMLGLDLDLEADLGIDSIKRIELAAALGRAVPAAFEGRAATMDRLSRMRTLNAIVDLLDTGPKGTVGAAGRAFSMPASDERVVRSVMVARREPLAVGAARRLGGLHLVTSDGSELTQRLASALRNAGAAPHIVPLESVSDEGRLRESVRMARAAGGPVSGILHLASSRSIPAGALFELLQLAAGDLERVDGARVLAVTGMGGSWGRIGRLSLDAALGAGCHGLLRSFEREYPGVRTSTLDLDPRLAEDVRAAAVAKEFLSEQVEPEVGFDGEGRMIWRATPAPLADAHDDHLRPSRGWVVLAIGGARGITAEIVQALAAPGVRLVLVGRGDEKRPDASAERERVTRAMIDAGADVTFEPCDVRDEAAFGSLIDNLYDRFGRLDAIVHGAGVIDDQRFDRKSRASFDRVFETKVNSTLALARHVRAGTLKWAAFFGSISGRFGNLGQADYAAANETMARLACAVDALWAPARVVTIHWGPWRGGGMASAAVQDVLSMQGIGLIQPAAGTKFFLDEVLSGSREREVIAGTGFWTATSDPPA